ncbi:MAG TPA: MFS transporter, partial [Nannocystaceae bacterium]|nr:MFS transporter [Nannocystaceae bacterium]
MAASPAPSWRDAIRGNVLAVGLVSLLSDFASEMVNPILPLFLAGVVGAGAAPLLLGVIEGLADTTASLLKIISGRVSDRIGRRKPLVVVGYVLANAARPLIGLCTTGGQVVALKVVDRIGKGLRTSPRDALIGDAAPPALRGLAFSFHRAMDHSGAVIGPLCAALLLFLLLGRLVWRGAEGELGPSELDDLSPIAHLTRLETLRASINHVSDLKPLEKLVLLDRLDLGRTYVRDIKPLENLVNLTELELDDTQVSDISPLSKAKKLERLSIRRT